MERSYCLKLSISIACFNNDTVTGKCLTYLKSNTEDLKSVEFILTNNGSSDSTSKILDDFDVPNKKIITNITNLGFGIAHNNALAVALGEYFLVLNNDLFIHEKKWNHSLFNQLPKQENIIVGLQGTNCTFRPDGTGLDLRVLFCGIHRLVHQFLYDTSRTTGRPA